MPKGRPPDKCRKSGDLTCAARAAFLHQGAALLYPEKLIAKAKFSRLVKAGIILMDGAIQHITKQDDIPPSLAIIWAKWAI